MNHFSEQDHSDDAAVLDQVQELTWALLDDNASEGEVSRLEGLLASSDSARQDYLRCVELHVGLHEHFAGAAASGEKPQSAAKSPILGFLNSGSLPIDVNVPTQD
jgi:hypothetical protein